MIELHERLSEFSYGYGVTREIEKLLQGMGIRSVPYMPNLQEEKKRGFDASFRKPGLPLLLQFKLGQSLSRFYRTDKAHPAPLLTRPFWRFAVDTGEIEGQFETLLKAEIDQAEVYYVAPRFSDWPFYAQLFEAEEVLESSVLVRPSEIRSALDSKGASDGLHRIVYDAERVHVCSEPARIHEVTPDEVVARLAQRIQPGNPPLGDVLENIFRGFDRRLDVRRPPSHADADDESGIVEEAVSGRATPEFSRDQRARRFSQLLTESRSRDHAVATAVGMELWTLGIQMILTEKADT
jgi:hypothetical protein